MDLKCRDCGAGLSFGSKFVNQKCFKCGSSNLVPYTAIYSVQPVRQEPEVVVKKKIGRLPRKKK